MYQNNNYTNKWFYAFITNMQYENNGTTLISISTDVWQTWQFDIIWKQSFIEREMVNVTDDIAGNNLIDEGLEIGETVISSQIEDDNLEPYYVIAYSGDYIDYQGTRTSIPQSGSIINGIPSSIAYIICGGQVSFQTMITIINDCSMGDKIFTCFTIPKIAFTYYQPNIINGIQTNLPCHIISTGSYPRSRRKFNI